MPARPPGQGPQSGFHTVEWLAELTGTALLVLGGLSAVSFDFSPHSPLASVLPSQSWRLLVTGLLFASSGALVTISPLGRRSGAHLNPAVTFAMWLQGKVHAHDLAGYSVSQLIGATLGTLTVRALWGSRAASVHDGLTQPGNGLNAAEGLLVEAAMTATLVLVIYAFLSSRRTMHWTPLAVLVTVAVLVWWGAPYTGTSLNPARSFGPALVSGDWHDYWVYVAGPLLGSLVAAGVWAVSPGVVLSAKLFHDTRYRSVLGSTIPSAGGIGRLDTAGHPK